MVSIPLSVKFNWIQLLSENFFSKLYYYILILKEHKVFMLMQKARLYYFTKIFI